MAKRGHMLDPGLNFSSPGVGGRCSCVYWEGAPVSLQDKTKGIRGNRATRAFVASLDS